MCGIAGLITLDREINSAASAVARMTDAMSHRGPDGSGAYKWSSGSLVVALGHRRLSIIDLSAEASQPFELPADDAAIVFNGEIYNYQSLADRAILDKTEVASRSDTATLAALMSLRWASGLPALNGIFAFAAWDGRAQKLLLVRDHLGVKPLYWALHGRTLIFASEVRAILASGLMSPAVDRDAVHHHLLFGSPIEPRTFVDGVHALAPGSAIEIDRGVNIRHVQWWSLPPRVTDIDDTRRVQTVRAHLNRSATAQMLADVEVGVFLSGGVDSTAVATLACRRGFRPRAISLFFENSPLSEEATVRETTGRLGIQANSVKLSADYVVAALPRWIDAQDQPSVDGLNMFLVSELARHAGLKVVLSGVGGDEVFGGYRGYASARRALGFARTMRALRRASRFALSARQHGLGATGSRLVDLLDGAIPPYFVSRALRGTALAASLTRGAQSRESLPADALSEYATISREPSLLRRLAMCETSFYLRNVLLRDADQMGMSQSLEVRVPLLDHELAASAISALGYVFPPRGISKPLLVDAMADEGVARVARDPKKGFTIPLGPWLRAPAGIAALRNLAAESASGARVFVPNAIERSIDRFAAGRESVYSTLSLVVAARWLTRHGISV